MSVGKKSLERVANVAATKDETVSAAEKTSEVKAQAPSPVKKSVKKTAATKKSDNTSNEGSSAPAKKTSENSAKKKSAEKHVVCIGDDMPVYLL